MIEVLYIHHGCVASSKWNAIVQTFFAHALTDWAVPFFLLISGFWFSRSSYVRGTQSYLQLWFKKARTLLVPYLGWVIIGAILVLPVIVFNNYVTHRALFERTVFEHRDIWAFVDALCGLAWVGLALAKSFGFAHVFARLIPFAGILFLWSISDWTWLYRDFMKATFWIFCLQMPLTGYSHNGPFFIFGKGDCATVLILLLTPCLNLAACLLAGDVVRRFAPRTYSVLTGGRS